MYDAFKRVADTLAAGILLIALSPLLLVLAVLVRLYLGSPVLFVQMRPGKGGELFRMLKFRTMSPAPAATSAVEAVGSDEARLTRFGRVLRSTSLDELPELLNVLVGQMSIVGPRPLLPEYLTRYNANQARRHEVRPGITGWA
ncbi:MAG: sugar transferase, partial [Actinomycetota bacterium]|nr:sugar transferase [Actinomycetota bacterium]